jgi:hypothetical protein
LRETRLLYLSSCQSCEENFAFELADKDIPAVIGFRWPVNNFKAREHARTFYQHLFKERSLERAFLRTRQDMHSKYMQESDRMDKSWAASMLILQDKRLEGP